MNKGIDTVHIFEINKQTQKKNERFFFGSFAKQQNNANAIRWNRRNRQIRDSILQMVQCLHWKQTHTQLYILICSNRVNCLHWTFYQAFNCCYVSLCVCALCMSRFSCCCRNVLLHRAESSAPWALIIMAFCYVQTVHCTLCT